MNRRRITKRVSLILMGALLSFSTLHASKESEGKQELSPVVQEGMDYFQGVKRFENGGPSCISCHNVTNDNVMAGGLFAKDLTDVYSRMNEGIAGWLMAPNFPAMKVAYSSAPLTEKERVSLTAFFKYANEHKDTQVKKSGFSMFLIGGVVGLILLFFAVEMIWSNRKKKMVKEEIFRRQKKSPDARF